MDGEALNSAAYLRHVKSCRVEIARSARKHRIGTTGILEILAKPRAAVLFATVPDGRKARVLVLGDDSSGRALEVVVVLVEPGTILTIHAMELRAKYREDYENGALHVQ